MHLQCLTTCVTTHHCTKSMLSRLQSTSFICLLSFLYLEQQITDTTKVNVLHGAQRHRCCAFLISSFQKGEGLKESVFHEDRRTPSGFRF